MDKDKRFPLSYIYLPEPNCDLDMDMDPVTQKNKQKLTFWLQK